MLKIRLSDSAYFEYAYSMTSDEFVARFKSDLDFYNSINILSKYIKSEIIDNGHTYKIIEVLPGDNELFIYIKVVK